MSIPSVSSSPPAGRSKLHTQLVEFRSEHSVPAVGAAIVTRDGLLDHAVAGVRVRGGDEPVELDDRWHLGSCGKSITAALYARLVERDEARWGARLPDLFPDLTRTLHPGWSAITIDDLFVSQAGLPANLARAAMLAALRDPRPLREQRTDVAAAALARAPLRPGRFLYSNLGYIVIGAAIERIAGRPFEEAVATHLLAPLGITSAGFGPPREVWGHAGRMLALGPLGHVDLGRGRPADPACVESDNPPVMSPAGRLHLSLGDWARFQHVFLTRGGDVLRPDTVERLLTPAPGDGYRQALGWAPARGLGGVSFGQVGSNTFWVAAAVIDASRERTAMVVCNDGRTRFLTRAPKLAAALLAAA